MAAVKPVKPDVSELNLRQGPLTGFADGYSDANDWLFSEIPRTPVPETKMQAPTPAPAPQPTLQLSVPWTIPKIVYDGSLLSSDEFFKRQCAEHDAAKVARLISIAANWKYRSPEDSHYFESKKLLGQHTSISDLMAKMAQDGKLAGDDLDRLKEYFTDVIAKERAADAWTNKTV